MRRISAVFLLLVAGFSQAATVSLDQSNPLVQNNGALAIISQQVSAQTFTTGLAGNLEQVDLALGYWPTATAGFEVSIYAGGGSPATVGTALFSQSYAASYVPAYAEHVSPDAFTAFDVSAANINVNIGDEFTIMVSRLAPTSGLDWVLWTHGQNYTGGESYVTYRGEWTEHHTDLGFQTYVSEVPIPAAVWLFGSALAGLGWIKRKQAT
jgi:hypothetical protein